MIAYQAVMARVKTARNLDEVWAALDGAAVAPLADGEGKDTGVAAVGYGGGGGVKGVPGERDSGRVLSVPRTGGSLQVAQATENGPEPLAERVRSCREAVASMLASGKTSFSATEAAASVKAAAGAEGGAGIVIVGEDQETGLRLAGSKEFSEVAKKRYPGVPNVWACSLHLFSLLLGKEDLADGVRAANARGLTTDVDVRAYLSDELGAAGRASRDRSGEVYVDSGRCGGYMRSDEFDAESEAEKWFFGPPPMPDDIVDSIVSAARRLLDEWLRPDEDELESMATWLARPSNYATSGSSKWARPLTSDGRALRSKWGIPLSSSADQIIDRVLTVNRGPVPLRIVGKRETEKIRGVVADDDRRYLVGRYLLRSIERRAVPGSPFSLFWSRRDTVGWYALYSRMIRAGMWSVPVDISKFDKDFSNFLLWRVQLAVLDRLSPGWEEAGIDDLRSRSPELAFPAACKLYSECLESSVDGRPTTRGLASGLAWTAFLGSLVNAALSVVCSEACGVPVRLRAHQGDDAAHCVDDEVSAVKLLVAYYLSGVPMNKKKNFLSGTKSEYLRNVSRAGEVYGYFSRAAVAILVRNPLNVDPLESEVDDILSRWGTMVARGADRTTSAVLMIHEVSARSGLPRSDVADALRTPRSVGGLGCAWEALTGRTALKRVESEGEVMRSKGWVSVVPGSTFYAAAEASAAAAGVQLSACLGATGRLLPPKGGKLRLQAVTVRWARPDLSLGAASLSLKPVFVPTFDPFFLDEIAQGEDKADAVARLLLVLEPGAFRDAVARLPAAVAVMLATGGIRTPVPGAAIQSDAVVAVAREAVDQRLLATLLGLHRPNVSVVRRLLLAAELTLRELLAGGVSEIPMTR